MLIDFHTHAFPDDLAPRALKTMVEQMAARQGVPVHPVADGTAAGLLRLMDEDAIDLSVLLPIATKPSTTTAVNRFAHALKSARILPFGSVHPFDPHLEAALAEVVAYGFPGIKLHPEFQNFYADAPESIRTLKICAAHGLIVVFHAGEDIGFRPPVRGTPVRLRRAMDAVPGARVVLAHMGGLRMWDDAAKYLADAPCYIDTSYVQKELPAPACRDLIRHFGAERVLFGSDSPWTRPRKDTFSYLEKLGLTAAELRLIVHENARQLLQGQIEQTYLPAHSISRIS